MATVEGLCTSIGVEAPQLNLAEVVEFINRPHCPFCNDHGAKRIPDDEGGGWEWMCGTFQSNKKPKPFQGIACERFQKYQEVERLLERHEGEPLADEALAIIGNLRGCYEW